jgi:hypothetical protein
MARTSPDLTGFYLKLDHAATHINTVSEQTQAFEVELALLIGDAIHNLRSALDHLVYELAPPKVRKRGKTQFPIFKDECEFKAIGAKWIAGISGDERALIERVQPWNAPGGAPADNPLAILNRLSNIDKHRLLIPVIAAVSEQNSWVASDNADVNFTWIERETVEDGAEILRFTATPKDPSIEMTVTPRSGLELQLSRAYTGASYGTSVENTLKMIHHHVRNIIEMWFERRFMPPTKDEIPPQ